MNENITEAVKLALEKDKPVIVLSAEEVKERGGTIVHHKNYVVTQVRPTEPVHAQRFAFEDMESLEAYIRRFIIPETGGIFHNERRIIAAQDAKEPFYGRGTYHFQQSDEAQDWLKCRNMNHKEFRDFLEARLPVIEEQDIYTSLATLKLNAKVEFTASEEDDRNVNFIFSQKDEQGSTKLPKVIHINIPLFRNSPETWRLEFRLRYNQPTASEVAVRFALECVSWTIIWREAVKKEIDKLKETLAEYAFYAGTPAMDEISKTLYGDKNAGKNVHKSDDYD